ncbi:e3 ubiquitin-protein ligase amfr [Anaeramoeba flamelloides]|uniref:E3 ubiquitin-protein ligase amfr n=1 Tax=Anaeramoeba flamelloides TaxID=1746091 RepID=A0ABQ8YDU0_9EUKA|nr:e3 ubiquitin-protein ligase amfr [Anaeramoeba flamelloides]
MFNKPITLLIVSFHIFKFLHIYSKCGTVESSLAFILNSKYYLVTLQFSLFHLLHLIGMILFKIFFGAATEIEQFKLKKNTFFFMTRLQIFILFVITPKSYDFYFWMFWYQIFGFFKILVYIILHRLSTYSSAFQLNSFTAVRLLSLSLSIVASSALLMKACYPFLYNAEKWYLYFLFSEAFTAISLCLHSVLKIYFLVSPFGDISPGKIMMCDLVMKLVHFLTHFINVFMVTLFIGGFGFVHLFLCLFVLHHYNSFLLSLKKWNNYRETFKQLELELRNINNNNNNNSGRSGLNNNDNEVGDDEQNLQNEEIVDICPICRDDIKNNETTLPCGHKIHTSCCRIYLEYQQTCPICRYPLLNGNNTPQQNQQETLESVTTENDQNQNQNDSLNLQVGNTNDQISVIITFDRPNFEHRNNQIVQLEERSSDENENEDDNNLESNGNNNPENESFIFNHQMEDNQLIQQMFPYLEHSDISNILNQNLSLEMSIENILLHTQND